MIALEAAIQRFPCYLKEVWFWTSGLRAAWT